MDAKQLRKMVDAGKLAADDLWVFNDIADGMYIYRTIKGGIEYLAEGGSADHPFDVDGDRIVFTRDILRKGGV